MYYSSKKRGYPRKHLARLIIWMHINSWEPLVLLFSDWNLFKAIAVVDCYKGIHA